MLNTIIEAESNNSTKNSNSDININKEINILQENIQKNITLEEDIFKDINFIKINN